jgi:hypothetical protein
MARSGPDVQADHALTVVREKLDAWVVPPDTGRRRTRGRGSVRRPATVTPLLVEWVEQFCTYLHKQRGRTAGSVQTYRWNLE